ncbi:dTDP-4-dehydrorhamnose 3,5-epimerase [Syntrophobotulus glycolicus DSM 8271]|uniref:dTDP-4-dehydrorhamnose 3,5-epimerase n=1 Tax=Syntrophobotulus glycolicus (strain DSM 8271 / FlGlyR) TaxID=645991 RepID=F0SX61_SYNGF|nr:dTDP-4-dehydrorhamnose 3,5-epimerase [Syntrophobotulus glycolicus]ADY56921.1 dTDP-4-dehydrorhamnose 3,5-epimerase [Syntrophobotulus glycolicus DSM 8271]
MEIIKQSKISGCFLLKPKTFGDERGTLIKPYHSDSYKALGLHSEYNEELVVTSHKNVIRGLHFQNPPFPQIKVVSCVMGRILDVVVDIRKGSPTYGEWEGFILDNENNYSLYVPEGMAHGYAVYSENTIVCYRMSNVFMPQLDSGIKWDSAGVLWDIESPIISPKDSGLISFDKFESRFVYK